MSKKLEAMIQETNNGAHYHVLLDFIPRKGEHLSLFSYLDQSTGHQPTHTYEVIDVVHEVYDVTEKVERSKNGHHAVKIIVRPSTSSVFQ